MHGWNHNRGRDAACSSAVMPDSATVTSGGFLWSVDLVMCARDSLLRVKVVMLLYGCAAFISHYIADAAERPEAIIKPKHE